MASTRNRLVLVGATAVGAAVAGTLGRGRILALIRGTAATPPAPTEIEPPPPPQPSNYDASGPVANTATPIPAPDPVGLEAIDEEAEIAAAAAEAAAIGGAAPEYPGLEYGEDADDASRPLEEAGEGEAEGQELAEFDLVDAAEPSDTPSDAQRRIEEAIEAQDELYVGETPEPLASTADEPPAEAEQAARDAAERAGEGIPAAEPPANFGGNVTRPPHDPGDGPGSSGSTGAP